MAAHLDQFWITSLMAVAIGLSVLFLLVRRDLVPAGAARDTLSPEKRWVLAGALGIGIFAFSLKLLVVFMLSTYPERTITPLLETARARAQNVTRASAKPAYRPITAPTPHTKNWMELPAIVPAPANNPTTPAKAALGRRLFNDPRLSKDKTLSCASCHDLINHAGADGRTTATGVGGATGPRNTPTVFNTAYQARLFWDGRSASLEDQAFGPLLNPIEMAMPSKQAVVDRVARDPSYGPAFEEAFGSGARITPTTIAQALAAFERTLVTRDSPYDRFVNGDETALSPAQKRGMHLFHKLGCQVCHAGANFSGASLIGPRRPFALLRADRLNGVLFQDLDKTLSADKGRNRAADSRVGLWRIPSLRNVALTAPYFHNGSVDTLAQAVRVMARAQLNAELALADEDVPRATPSWDAARYKFYGSERKTVSDQDIADLVAFLQALSSDRLAKSAGSSSPRFTNGNLTLNQIFGGPNSARHSSKMRLSHVLQMDLSSF